MLRSIATPLSSPGTSNQRDGKVATEHISRLGDVVEKLVCGFQGEVWEHDLDDRFHTDHRRTKRYTTKTIFCNWRAEYSVWERAECVACTSICAAPKMADFLTENKNFRITLHRPVDDA